MQMEQKRYIFALATILCVAVVSAEDTADPFVVVDNSKVLCGHVLTEALSLVCKGKYNALKAYSKRSVRYKRSWLKTQKIITDEDLDKSLSSAISYPFLSKQSATNMIKTRRRIIRGVANECCSKPCSKSEMMSYCAQ